MHDPFSKLMEKDRCLVRIRRPLICLNPLQLMIGEVPPKNLPQPKKNGIPVQSLPPPLQPIADPGTIYNLGPDTNLVRLLDDIRDLSKNGELDSAQSLAGRALEKISRTEENSFYLRQIRKEETQLYFKRANQAMKDKNYSLASQFACPLPGKCSRRP